MHPLHSVYLQFCYYGSLIAIHTCICYPWLRPGEEHSLSPAIQTQRQESTEIVAKASRHIIMATQQLQINAASPFWFVVLKAPHCELN